MGSGNIEGWTNERRRRTPGFSPQLLLKPVPAGPSRTTASVPPDPHAKQALVCRKDGRVSLSITAACVWREWIGGMSIYHYQWSVERPSRPLGWKVRIFLGATVPLRDPFHFEEDEEEGEGSDPMWRSFNTHKSTNDNPRCTGMDSPDGQIQIPRKLRRR
jgi:hypothetical protein